MAVPVKSVSSKVKDIDGGADAQKLPAGGGVEAQVKVRFVPRNKRYTVPDAPVLVPCHLRRLGLSEVINYLLDLDKPIPFDFIISGQFLRTSLGEYLESESLSSENVLIIDYFPASLPPQPSTSLPAKDWVGCVDASSPSVGLVASGSYDCSARIWNLSGKCIATLDGALMHTSAVKDVRLLERLIISDTSQTTRGCITASLDSKVMLWKWDAPKDLTGMPPAPAQASVAYVCEGHDSGVESIALSPDASSFSTAGWDGSILTWNLKDAPNHESQRKAGRASKKMKKEYSVLSPSSSLFGHVGSISAVDYDTSSTSGRMLWSGGQDHSVRQWDLEASDQVTSLTCESSVLALKHSKASQLLASGHADNMVRLWDPRAQNGHAVKMTLASHRNWVSSVSWCPNDPHRLVSGGLDGSIKVWDIRSITPVHTIPLGTEDRQLCVTWNGETIWSGGEGGEIHSFVFQ